MERKFEAPGPGTWSLDTTHNSAAMTRYTAECFSGLPRGFGECMEKYGILLDRLQPAFIHGFFFMQQVGVVGKPGGGPPPKWLLQLMFQIHPKLRARVKAAHESVQSRLWLRDLDEWDELKKDSIVRNTKLQSVDLSQLDREELIAHLETCFENAEEMVYRHHKFSVGAILPVGRFLDAATSTSGLSPVEVAPLLKGSTPVSRGIGGEQLVKLAEVVTSAGFSKDDLASADADATLASLRENSAIAAALEEYLVIAGHMLIGGYCISEKTLRESPNIIMARILEALQPRAEDEFDKALEQKIRDKIPEADREEFDLCLADARAANRMRDERGIYNDIWGAGISRTAILEAGRRLFEEGVLSQVELSLDATHEELIGLLKGESITNDAELSDRREWRLTKSIDEVPEFLGDPLADQPPVEIFPKKMQPTMRAFGLTMSNVFDEPRETTAKVEGLAVSPGIYEGTAKVIISTRDFDRLDKGDVLVTKNTSAGFNVVLPIIGALVTDRGGILSHAAIVSREFGIPGVVGTKNASQQIKDGDRVRGEWGYGRGRDSLSNQIDDKLNGAVPLRDAADENLYGGKCVSLGSALRANLPAPDGYALAVELVNAIASGEQASVQSVLPLFDELAPAVAVRSSAVGEDSVEASFAGQHLTVLNVMDAPGMMEAIKQVHASAYTEEAIAYRAKMGVEGEPAISVVLQQQILSEVAGVMFTKNPLTGETERYIEASWGLGEAVVAGMVVPDSFRIASTGEILEQVAGDKDVELVASADGETIEQDVEGARVSDLCLSAEDLGRLHNLAVECEQVYGKHIDIEWAFHAGHLYLLQCRAITN